MGSSIMSRGDFLGLERVVHLAAGGESPMLRAAAEALQHFAMAKGMGYVGGYSGRRHFYEVYAAAKSHVAALLGCVPSNVAFLSSASDGLNEVVAGIRFRPGDNVVTLATEFPSVSLPWMLRSADGVEIRAVKAEPGQPLTDTLLEACDHRTRAVAVSHVSYMTGERVDLERLSRATRSTSSLLIVDASHSLGVLRVPAALADFVCSCCYKFLLATHGVGVFYWNQETVTDWEPSRVGWHSVSSFPPKGDQFAWKPDAAQFEPGNPNFPGIYVLETSARYLGRIQLERLEAHVLRLGTVLWQGLDALGLEVSTPFDPERRGPNVCFRHPEAETVTTALRQEGIYVWGDQKRVRISLHGYTDDADVAAFLETLGRLLRR